MALMAQRLTNTIALAVLKGGPAGHQRIHVILDRAIRTMSTATVINVKPDASACCRNEFHFTYVSNIKTMLHERPLKKRSVI
jgi:hypothetical protein